jgi:hypothetical protein
MRRELAGEVAQRTQQLATTRRDRVDIISGVLWGEIEAA